MTYRRKGLTLATSIALLAGCTTASPRSALLHSCEAYASTLLAVSAAAVRGRLTGDQVQTVSEITTILNPICSAPPATEDGATVVLGAVRAGLEKLVFLQTQGEKS